MWSRAWAVPRIVVLRTCAGTGTAGASRCAGGAAGCPSSALGDGAGPIVPVEAPSAGCGGWFAEDEAVFAADFPARPFFAERLAQREVAAELVFVERMAAEA